MNFQKQSKGDNHHLDLAFVKIIPILLDKTATKQKEAEWNDSEDYMQYKFRNDKHYLIQLVLIKYFD